MPTIRGKIVKSILSISFFSSFLRSGEPGGGSSTSSKTPANLPSALASSTLCTDSLSSNEFIVSTGFMESDRRGVGAKEERMVGECALGHREDSALI